jgi:hypothetical protein
MEALAGKLVGQPFVQKLSATESDGIVKVLEASFGLMDKVTPSSCARSIHAEDGAVARFLRSLRELKSADEDRAQQLSAALTALNARRARF